MAITPFMNLSLPTVTVTIGPLWATQLNAALSSVDEHDHTNAKGKLIPTAGININSNLDLNEYSPYNALSLKFSSQLSTLIGASNSSSIYVVNGNLYYTNGSGIAVQITSGGGVAATPGAAISFPRIGISGDLIISPSDTFSVISVDTTMPRLITLPSVGAVVDGRIYIVKDALGDSLANPITIVPNGADTIDGESSITLDSQYSTIMLIGNGTSTWYRA